MYATEQLTISDKDGCTLSVSKHGEYPSHTFRVEIVDASGMGDIRRAHITLDDASAAELKDWLSNRTDRE